MEEDIDLTPLIDVVFVILIMFIVIAPLLELDRISLADGTGERTSLKETGAIAIQIDAQNQLKANGRPVAQENLPAWLQQMQGAHPGAIPQLTCDRASQFGAYQMVKNAVEDAGFAELDLVLQPS